MMMMMSGVKFPLTDRACSVKMEALSLLLQSPSSLQSGGFLWVDAIELNGSHDAGSGPSLSCQHAADPSGFHLSICKRLSRNHSSYLIFTELRITFWATGAVGRASSSAPFPHPQLQTWSGASSAPQ